MLIDLGCDPDKACFDVPRMRTSTAPQGYLNWHRLRIPPAS
jgi:hypothetical protein